MLFTYRCDKGHSTERLRNYSNRKLPSNCGTCNEVAKFVQEFSTKSQSFGFFERHWDMREKKREVDNRV